MRSSGVREQIISFSRANWQMEKMYVPVSARLPWNPLCCLSLGCYFFHQGCGEAIQYSGLKVDFVPLLPFSFASSQPLLQQPKVEVHAEWDVFQETSPLHLFEQQIIIAKFLFPAKYCGLRQEEEMVTELHIVPNCSCAYTSHSLGNYQPHLTAFPNWACGAKQQNWSKLGVILVWKDLGSFEVRMRAGSGSTFYCTSPLHFICPLSRNTDVLCCGLLQVSQAMRAFSFSSYLAFWDWSSFTRNGFPSCRLTTMIL